MAYNAFTTAERIVAQQLADNPVHFCMDHVDQTVDVYMGPIAAFIVRGDMSDAAKVSAFNELLQQYDRDAKDAVCEEEQLMAEAKDQAEREVRQFHQRMAPSLRPVGY